MSSLGALAGHRIVPVIVIDDPSHAVDLAHALLSGAINCAEVTMRTPGALDALRAMTSIDGFTAGAGTVRSIADWEAAVGAGASFCVCPGFDERIVERSLESNVGVLPGIATATELQRALQAGVTTVKFFPADRLGGLAGIRALSAPFPEIGFVPSGGVTAESAAAYLAHPAVPAVSGSWMAPRELIASRGFNEIARLSAESVAAIRQL